MVRGNGSWTTAILVILFYSARTYEIVISIFCATWGLRNISQKLLKPARARGRSHQHYSHCTLAQNITCAVWSAACVVIIVGLGGRITNEVNTPGFDFSWPNDRRSGRVGREKAGTDFRSPSSLHFGRHPNIPVSCSVAKCHAFRRLSRMQHSRFPRST